MLTNAKNLYDYRELMATLAWRNIALRYKRAYLGIFWAILKPLALLLFYQRARRKPSRCGHQGPLPHCILSTLLPPSLIFRSYSTIIWISALDSSAADSILRMRESVLCIPGRYRITEPRTILAKTH